MAGVLRVVRGDALLSELLLNEGEAVQLDSEKVKNREEDEKPTITNLIARIVPAEEVELPETVEDEESTKEELMERARDLEIEGRSSMNKDELAAAIKDAEGKEG